MTSPNLATKIAALKADFADEPDEICHCAPDIYAAIDETREIVSQHYAEELSTTLADRDRYKDALADARNAALREAAQAVATNSDWSHKTILALLTQPDRSAARQKMESFQSRVAPWMQACFGEAISRDGIERNHRFLEEALELVQACGCTADEAHQLVDYVYGRPVGDPSQEVGGVMVTLAAHCLAHGVDMHEAGETELGRIWTKVEQIRAKQAAKPKHSPLPMAVQELQSSNKEEGGK